MSRELLEYKILDEASVDGAGISANCRDFIDKTAFISTNGLGSGDTIKIVAQVGYGVTAPNFDSAKSKLNKWENSKIRDLETGDEFAGDTGITISDADDCKHIKILDDNANWITLSATINDKANTNVTAYIYLSNNA